MYRKYLTVCNTSIASLVGLLYYNTKNHESTSNWWKIRQTASDWTDVIGMDSMLLP